MKAFTWKELYTFSKLFLEIAACLLFKFRPHLEGFTKYFEFHGAYSLPIWFVYNHGFYVNITSRQQPVSYDRMMMISKNSFFIPVSYTSLFSCPDKKGGYYVATTKKLSNHVQWHLMSGSVDI